MKYKRLLFTLVLVNLLIVTSLQAHRPVIVKSNSSLEEPFIVPDSNISYAFYGELNGEAHYYKIKSEKPFNLYVNILVPDFSPKSDPIVKHDMSFQIFKNEIKSESSIFLIDGKNAEWKRFYEKFGRDHYYMGPEFDMQMPAGTYYIKVFNSNYKGKYALATGKVEKFGIKEIISSISITRKLDKWFFKP